MLLSYQDTPTTLPDCDWDKVHIPDVKRGSDISRGFSNGKS